MCSFSRRSSKGLISPMQTPSSSIERINLVCGLVSIAGARRAGEHKAYAYLLLPREMMTRSSAQTDQRHQAVQFARRRFSHRDAPPGDSRAAAYWEQLKAVTRRNRLRLILPAAQTGGGAAEGRETGFGLDVDLRPDFVTGNEAEFVEQRISAAVQPGSPALGKEPFNERMPAFIPITYISDTSFRIRAYRDVAEITTQEQLERLGRDWRDRFGQFPRRSRIVC